MIRFKGWKGRTYSQEYSTQQDSHADLTENQKLSRQAKVKRIQHHQASFITNGQGTSPDRKHKRRKRPAQIKPRTIKKMVLGSYILIITLSVKWIKCSNQKTLIGWANENMCMYALPLTTSLYLTLQIICNYFILLG